MASTNSLLDELVSLLPIQITQIQVQKKNKERYSLYHEDTFLLGVSIQTLITYNLKKGTILDEGLVLDIQNQEEQSRCKDYLLGLLARRDHSLQELKTKGLKKGYSSNRLDTVLASLLELNYVDNTRFAERYIHDAVELKKWSLNRIASELQKKGISRSVYTPILNQYSTDLWLTQMQALVKKNYRKFTRIESDKRKKKLYDFLARKGYSPTLIWSHMNNLLSLIETTD